MVSTYRPAEEPNLPRNVCRLVLVTDESSEPYALTAFPIISLAMPIVPSYPNSDEAVPSTPAAFASAPGVYETLCTSPPTWNVCIVLSS